MSTASNNKIQEGIRTSPELTVQAIGQSTIPVFENTRTSVAQSLEIDATTKTFGVRLRRIAAICQTVVEGGLVPDVSFVSGELSDILLAIDTAFLVYSAVSVLFSNIASRTKITQGFRGVLIAATLNFGPALPPFSIVGSGVVEDLAIAAEEEDARVLPGAPFDVDHPVVVQPRTGAPIFYVNQPVFCRRRKISPVAFGRLVQRRELNEPTLSTKARSDLVAASVDPTSLAG